MSRAASPGHLVRATVTGLYPQSHTPVLSTMPSNTTADALAQAVKDNLAPSAAELAEKIPTSKEEVKAVAAGSTLSQIKSFIAGGFGGVCAVIVGHPFDLVKVRLQTAERGLYKGAFDVVRKSVARDGLARGLYAGVSAPLVGVTPMCEWQRSPRSMRRTSEMRPENLEGIPGRSSPRSEPPVPWRGTQNPEPRVARCLVEAFMCS